MNDAASFASRARRPITFAALAALAFLYAGSYWYWHARGSEFPRSARLRDAPRVAAGTTLGWRAADRTPAALLHGWANAEGDGHWSFGPVAEIAFRPDPAQPPRRLVATVVGAVFPDGDGPQRIAVAVDGRHRTAWLVAQDAALPAEYSLDLGDLPVDRAVVVSLRPQTVLSPLLARRYNDHRPIGVKLAAVRLE